MVSLFLSLQRLRAVLAYTFDSLAGHSLRNKKTWKVTIRISVSILRDKIKSWKVLSKGVARSD